MNGLDLFSGIGGMSIALQEWVRPIAYCEIDPYCQGVLLSRMASGALCYAPIWDDVRTLEFRAEDRLAIDILYGGFPCQDISIAGNGKGLEGERSSLFFEIIRLAKQIKPKFIFIENVPAITSRGGLRVVKEIASLEYDCRWCVISASSVGAPHKRDRWFFLAHSYSKSRVETYKDAESKQIEKAARIRFTRQNRGDISCDYWQESECPCLGMDDGLPYQLERAKTLGNAVVPAQAKDAFKILMGL